jgi:hypothetical protein
LGVASLQDDLGFFLKLKSIQLLRERPKAGTAWSAKQALRDRDWQIMTRFNLNYPRKVFSLSSSKSTVLLLI